MTEERIKLLEEEKKKIKVLEKTMTVAKIIKYIDTLTKYYTEDFGKYDRERPENIIVYLQDIKSMLDQLEGKLEMLERIENDKNLEEDFKKVAWEIAAENNELRYKLNQLNEQKISIDNIVSKMRPATKEELEGIDEYVKGISVTIDNEECGKG